MRVTYVLYLLLCIKETRGQVSAGKDSLVEKLSSLPSTTSGKQLKIIRDILNQESLSRFSMIQKIETLVMDAIDSKNFSQALEKRLRDVVKELGDLKTNDHKLKEANALLKDEIKDLYFILSNYTTIESENVQSLNDSEILYLKRKTLFLENEIQTLSLQNLDINKQLVFLMKKDLNSLKNETFALNQKYDKMLQEKHAFQNQSLMNGRQYTRVIERLLTMENDLQSLLKSWNKLVENNHKKTTDVKECEKGWIKFEETCYLFSSFTTTFKEAVNFCVNTVAGAHLIEIKNPKVEKWLDLQFKIQGFQNAWIGLTDLLKENEYVSISTGRKPTYTNWYKNQPSNSGNVEHCAEKRPLYSWNDNRCDARIPFVCELSP